MYAGCFSENMEAVGLIKSSDGAPLEGKLEFVLFPFTATGEGDPYASDVRGGSCKSLLRLSSVAYKYSIVPYGGSFGFLGGGGGMIGLSPIGSI